MDAPGIEAYVAVAATILLGALLAAVEAGLHAIGDVGLQALRDEGHRDAAVAERVLRLRGTIRARLLAGRVLSVAVAVTVAAGAALDAGGALAALAAALGTAFVYALVAEISTTIVARQATFLPLRLLRWLRPLEWLLALLAWPLEWAGRWTERRLPPVPDERQERLTELAVEHMIEQGEETGSIEEDHAALLRRVLEFKNTEAREVMVPRTNMVAFDSSTPLEEVLERVVATGHSRYPVYRERIDQVEGLLYAKDLFGVLRDGNDGQTRLEQLIRRPVFLAPETEKIGSLLREMQARRVHLAVVVDEFGGTSGIVTLEDILEEIVGEIRDEHDAEEPRVMRVEPGRYLADASVSINDLEEILGTELAPRNGEYESLGGLVVELAGKLPEVGESVSVSGFDMYVRDADERHVTQVELIRREGPKSSESDEAAE